MESQRTNWLAIIACVVIAQVVPMIWYGVFADPWMEGNHFTRNDFKDTSPLPYVVNLISSFIQAWVLALLLQKIGVRKARTGFLTGLLIGFAFVLMQTATSNLFSHRVLALTFIDGGYPTIVFGLMGLILAVWRK